jgi:hemerythrin
VEIVWQSWFEVGHDRIDAEHRAFFDIVKAIDLESRSGGDKMRILRTLSELKLYTEFHFASEENIMEDFAYPDVRSHREGHKVILRTMNEHMDDIRFGIDRIEELVTFLYSWFCGHTVNEDVKLSRYISKAQQAE